VEKGEGRVGKEKEGRYAPVGESGSTTGRGDGRGEGQEGELGLRRPRTSFFHTLSAGYCTV